ncbi:MAG: sugar transferase [Bacteroidales bacterium]|nr:sugar transferase [Bacteroidales bacterium]
MSAFEKFCKRAFDIALSGVLLIVFSPLIMICALAVLIEDGSPVIYSQERIGLGGRPFHILKFRSMRLDAEAMGIPMLYSGDDDPRLTRVGKFLRQHHLDELPQLWNVFRGDMSFIGYRPERQFYIDRIMERNPRYRYLYQIRPGVTSYATLYNGYTDTLEKMLTRLDLDLYYLRNHSVLFDFRVLGMTFLRIVSGQKF